MRYTLDASVRFRATPPAFKLTRKMVTSTLFTDDRSAKGVGEGWFMLTEMLDRRIARLWAHASFKSTNLQKIRAIAHCSKLKGDLP